MSVCREVTYEMLISSATWPSDEYKVWRVGWHVGYILRVSQYHDSHHCFCVYSPVSPWAIFYVFLSTIFLTIVFVYVHPSLHVCLPVSKSAIYVFLCTIFLTIVFVYVHPSLHEITLRVCRYHDSYHCLCVRLPVSSSISSLTFPSCVRYSPAVAFVF